jgi:hypothetical protein
LDIVAYSHETIQESIWSHSVSSTIAAASTVPSMWERSPNFSKVSSKKFLHCRKLTSSTERVTGTWLRMLSSTRVEAGGGAGSVELEKGLVVAEEAEEAPLGLSMTKRAEARIRIEN